MGLCFKQKGGCMYQDYSPIYNKLKGDPVDLSEDSGVITEPVTVQEMKNYMRLEGFESDNESGEMPFISDDTEIEEQITASRQRFEKWSGRSVVRHRWKQIVTNQIGDIELPYSNNYTIFSLHNCDGVEILSENYKIRDHEFLFLESPLNDNMTVVYDAGPEDPADVPKVIKKAIMRDVLFYYENRNDGDDKENRSFECAAFYKRVSTWLG
jgi:hypothetical protein